MKVLTILGTRPELIRLSLIIKKLDKLCDQVLVHTGQNFDPNLNDVFIEQLGIRKMDYYLDAKGNFGQQAGTILSKLEEIIPKEKPDAFLVLGDTNSSLGAIMAKRLGVRVFHMEAGNRCFDDRVPEENNRRIIDSQSDILLTYSNRSRQMLTREGYEENRVHVSGNPIFEVMKHFEPQIDASDIMQKLKVEKGKFFLMTLHRAENVDPEDRLAKFVEAFNKLHDQYKMPMIWSVHPKTRDRLKSHPKLKVREGIVVSVPLGFFEFQKLQKNAFCVLSDSGTAQEECAILGVPVVTTRDVTERHETFESGSNFISGAEPEDIIRGVKVVTESENNWNPPPEYLVPNVSDIVIRIVLSYWPPASPF
ncbi:UDP-N-acetylglucosamine 2-epimerase [Candidatus Saccharibacteria bacterium RIFCSPHIGHO2_12_FULL_47_16b]|nr:MAG: UDP-N-acetylglucosamine 2-epimerase [Candidatus Saccharibacteria bacterium RIFCSPHIGHO2_12_FULL_47_16b]